MNTPRTVEGDLVLDAQPRIGIVIARFNSFIVDQLERGCLDALRRHGIADEAVTMVKVPGAFELPVAARQMLGQDKYDAIIALGCIIRGGTPHFDYVAGACTTGLGTVAADVGVPITLGVLTVDSIEQAIERAGTKAGNRGADAALAAIEMISVARRL
ncbi:MAG: 6,7-dimethyl-8-ribityllumazine synthase [Gammaproteobacteria bacterium]|nr:6,7-dimethyl-8-ribityllumazine synthase [Gammaproteobacteria bacterium]